MAEVDDLIDDVEFRRSVPVSCRPEDIDFPVVLPASDFHKIEIKERETGQWKKKDSKGQISPQQKKELYTKLDDILFTALRQEFEVCPGNTIDRLEMVQFLTSVVHQHLSDCPDLKKVLDLRDTVLTGRVKKVFPEVEYKRKQIKQDHYRKAWLYVNIRRKHNSMSTCNLSSASITMKTSTWTQPTDPTALMSNFSSSPSSPAYEAHSPSSYINTNTYEYGCSAALLVLDEPGVTQHQDSPPSGSGSNGMASYHCAQFSSDNLPSERTALMLDNLTLQKWVVSHYAADNLSYVPVQDVVKAFRKDFNVDISYKECHQMILSAFTSPRNRLIPRKTVRVSSIGQQYVYRGIAPLNKATSSSEEAQVAEEFEFVQPTDQSEKTEEEGEAWERKIRDITVERDQALMERNQALTALMELEKEHAEAVRTIERLKTETLSNRFVESVSKKSKDLSTKGDELSVNHCDSASLGNLLLKFGNATRNKLRYTRRDGKHDGNTDRHLTNECSHEQYDEYSFLKEVVTQAKEERDYLLKRLEIVKGERNSYLERLHSLEKHNQRLRDAVSVRNSDIFQNGLLDDISRHFQTSYHEESNAKEALSSVLSHLKSKRKQVTPSRLNKSPKYDHTTLNEQSTAQVSFDGQSNHLGECSSPASTVDNGVPSPGKLVLPNAGLRRNEKERLCNGDVEKISGNSQGNLGGEGGQSKDDLLVFTSGSGMVGFTPHPLDD